MTKRGGSDGLSVNWEEVEQGWLMVAVMVGIPSLTASPPPTCYTALLHFRGENHVSSHAHLSPNPCNPYGAI